MCTIEIEKNMVLTEDVTEFIFEQVQVDLSGYVGEEYPILLVGCALPFRPVTAQFPTEGGYIDDLQILIELEGLDPVEITHLFSESELEELRDYE